MGVEFFCVLGNCGENYVIIERGDKKEGFLLKLKKVLNSEMLDLPRAIFGTVTFLGTVKFPAHFDKMSFCVAVKSKRGAEISTLFLDSPSSQWDLQQDLGVLAHQAFPLELRYRLPPPGLLLGAQVYRSDTRHYSCSLDKDLTQSLPLGAQV